MDITDIHKKITGLLADLPVIQQDALNEIGWEGRIADIADAYNLDQTETMWLYVYTGLILAQARNPESFATDLKSRITKPDETIRAIIARLGKDIFQPMQSSLEELLPPDEPTALEAEVAELLKDAENNGAHENKTPQGFTVPKKRTPLVPQKPRKTHYDGSDPYHEDLE